jgi:SAM-dependent methyltransferase
MVKSTSSAQAYWNQAADAYDQEFTRTVIGRAERAAVWLEFERVFHFGQRILELNCGTGIDAVHLARSGVKVLACDIAPRMIEIARARARASGLEDWVDFRVLATEQISALSNQAPFDGVFSNFAGLNCIADLGGVARALAQLLKPGGRALFCMLGRFVPWETVWSLLHRNPREALPRFTRGVTVSHFAGHGEVRVHYPSVRAVRRFFAQDFRLRQWKGIGVTLPPAYFESWARGFPKTLDLLARADRWLGHLPLLRGMADLVLLQFERL